MREAYDVPIDFDDLPPAIIIDGADGVGKSTMAAVLRDMLQESTPLTVHVVHSGPPTTHREKDHAIQMRNAFSRAMEWHANGGDITIFDRLHLSNYVYAITRHNFPDARVGLEEARRLFQTALKFGCYHVLMQRPLGAVKTYLDEAEADLGGSAQHPNLEIEWTLFNDLAGREWDKHTFDDISGSYAEMNKRARAAEILYKACPSIPRSYWTFNDPE